MDDSGKITRSKNGEAAVFVMDADVSKKPLWFVLDVYGSTTAIQLMGELGFCFNCNSIMTFLSVRNHSSVRSKTSRRLFSSCRWRHGAGWRQRMHDVLQIGSSSKLRHSTVRSHDLMLLVRHHVFGETITEVNQFTNARFSEYGGWAGPASGSGYDRFYENKTGSVYFE